MFNKHKESDPKHVRGTLRVSVTEMLSVLPSLASFTKAIAAQRKESDTLHGREIKAYTKINTLKNYKLFSNKMIRKIDEN